MSTAIVVHGWLGDALFASSIAEKLIKEGQTNSVDYVLGFPQTEKILNNNPYIRNVFVHNVPGPNPPYAYLEKMYDHVHVLPVNDLVEVPTVKFQRHCGVSNPTTEFNIDVPVEYKKHILNGLGKTLFNGKKNIGLCATWKMKHEVLFDVGPLAAKLSKYYNVFPIGRAISQYEGANDVNGYIQSAALCSFMDYVVGAEGGLTNLAAGMGTNVIYTTDFTYFLFGPEGRLYKYDNPLERIGPLAFFPTRNHVALDKDLDYNYLDEAIRNIVK